MVIIRLKRKCCYSFNEKTHYYDSSKCQLCRGEAVGKGVSSRFIIINCVNDFEVHLCYPCYNRRLNDFDEKDIFFRVYGEEHKMDNMVIAND